MEIPQIVEAIKLAKENDNRFQARIKIRELVERLPEGPVPEGVIWTAYWAFNAFNGKLENLEKLPKYIGTWISRLALRKDDPNFHGVHFGDIFELLGIVPSWADPFNWTRLAVTSIRDKLEEMKASPDRRGRLAPSIWTAIDRAWALADAGDQAQLQALQAHHDVHEYDVAVGHMGMEIDD